MKVFSTVSLALFVVTSSCLYIILIEMDELKLFDHVRQTRVLLSKE